MSLPLILLQISLGLTATSSTSSDYSPESFTDPILDQTPLGLITTSNASLKCVPESFTSPTLEGAEILGVNAREVHNFSTYSVAPDGGESLWPGGTNEGSIFTVDFCNVTVTYTHPGRNDVVNVYVWLPLTDWNGKLQAVGGGGYNVGLGLLYMPQALADGYVVISSDGGFSFDLAESSSPEKWALTSPGNVNMYLLENYASRALLDLPIVGKAMVEQYFGRPPSFSYFRGCSGGGRQAHMIAQRAPESFDGYMAADPALHIDKFIPAGFWGLTVMNHLGVYPPACEIDAFTAAAIEACDEDDGVKDGIISNPSACDFNAADAVGSEVDCDGIKIQLSKEAAQIVQAIWDGPRNSDGTIGWWGPGKEATLTTLINGYAWTVCSANNATACGRPPISLWPVWHQCLVNKDPAIDISNVTAERFLSSLQLSGRLYDSLLATRLTDLSALRASKSKMITTHSLGDQSIPYKGTEAYYQQVLRRDPQAADYYRYFEVPGHLHCFGGPRPYPHTAFEQRTDVLSTISLRLGTTAVLLLSNTASHLKICKAPPPTFSFCSKNLHSSN